MRVEILGRVRLSRDDGPVRLTELESGLLGLAALHGRVGVDSLAEWLWDNDPPSSVRNRVQSLVSGIRRKAGTEPPVVVTDGRGYRLDDAVAVDVAEWGDLVSEARALRSARPEQALALYDRALAVFEYEPLQGSPRTAAVEVERNRLVQERLSVVEERHEAALRSGALDGLVADLETLVARHPYHEGFIALFMLALAASGQQSRALEVYQDARTRLDVELGVLPSERLADAQRLVLTGGTVVEGASEGDPATRPGGEARGDVANGASGGGSNGASGGGSDEAGGPTVDGLPVPRMLPRRPASFVGREAEIAQIAAAADEVDGAAAVVSVTGLPGSGTSALALEAGHRLRHRFPGGTLYHDAGNTPGEVSVDAVVSSFLPLLGVHPEAVPTDPQARVGLYRSLLDGRGVLVVVDNVACSDGGGCGLADLLPTSAGSMGLVTSRRPVGGLVATRRVRVHALDEDAARALLTHLVGPQRVAEEPEAAADVLRLTGRVPLGLRLAAGRLAQRPDLTLEDLVERLERFDGAGGPVDVDGIGVLRQSLDRILEDLDPDARRVVEAVAHLPVDRFSGWVAGAVLGEPVAGDRAVDAVVEASLVETVLQEGHDAQFRLHDLVRSHVRARARRGTVEGHGAPTHPTTTAEHVAVAEDAVRRSGTLLRTLPQRFVPPAPRPGGGRVPASGRPRRGANRFFRTETPLLVALAGRVVGDRPDLGWRLLADTALGTDAATDVHAWFEAERTVSSVLVTTDGDGDGGLGSAVLLLCRAWLLQDRRSLSREALDLAEAARRRLVLLGVHEHAAAASLVAAQAATSLGLRERADTAVEQAEASMGRAPDPVLAAWAAIARGTIHNDYDEIRDAAREFTRAREILAATPRTVAYGLATLELSRARRRTGELGPATLLVDEALATLAEVGAVHMYSYALDARAEVSLAAGHPEEAREEAATALARATTSRDAFLAARARRTHGRALLALGRLDEAEREMRSAVEEFTALDRPLSAAFTYGVLAGILDSRGDAVGASECLRLEEAALRRAAASPPSPARRSPGPA